MTIIQNDKWYLEALHLNDINEELDWDSMNINETTGGRSFIHYPNIPSGYPSVAVELESFGEFRLPRNYNSGKGENAKRYPETYLDSDNNYIVFIPMYEYTTNTGVHVTKVVTTLQRNDTQEILLLEEGLIESGSSDCFYRFKNDNANIYYILKTTSWFNPEHLGSFREKTAPNGKIIVDINKMKDISLYKVNIGPSCNVLLELTVDYYFYNIKLGTYTVVFNPYMLDIIKNYNIGELVPENDYHGYGTLYISQFYELNPNTLYKDIVKPGPDINPGSDVKPLKIYKAVRIPAELIQKGIIRNVNKSMLRIDYSKILNNSSITATDDGKYLYKDPVNALDPINIHYKLLLHPNNCSLGIWASDSNNYITDDFKDNPELTVVKYTIFPGKSDFERNLVIIGKYGRLSGTGIDFLKYSSKDDDLDHYTYEKTFNTLQDFKDEKLETYNLASLKIQAVLCDSDIGYNYINNNDTVATVVDAKNYTNTTKLNPAGNDVLSWEISYDCPFSANNLADYKVIAQFNTLCKVDDTYYLGYKDSEGVIYPSNINSNNNYLMANCRSESNLIFTENVDYVIKHYEGTSLYHQGLVYFDFINNATQNISLNKGVYVININYIGILPTISINPLSLNHELSPTYNTTNNTTNSLSAVIYIPDSKAITISISKGAQIVSMGLYKIYENEGTEELKNKLLELYQSNDIKILNNTLDYTYLQTVYTYKEDNKKCLDKVYNYTGYPQHGYLILAYDNPHYTISDDNLTTKILGEKIQIRE